jgi:hypothetical protein
METRSLAADANLCDKRQERPHADAGPLVRYELNVIAANVADVVASIGGWLFDRRAGGWDVNVLLHGEHDRRALRILGVGSRELDPWLSGVDRGDQRGAGLAVASDLRATDKRIEEEVRDALRSGDIEVVQWGPAESPERGDRVEYRLSAAARIFKCHALAAACLTSTPVGVFETLWRPRSVERIRA